MARTYFDCESAHRLWRMTVNVNHLNEALGNVAQLVVVVDDRGEATIELVRIQTPSELTPPWH